MNATMEQWHRVININLWGDLDNMGANEIAKRITARSKRQS